MFAPKEIMIHDIPDSADDLQIVKDQERVSVDANGEVHWKGDENLKDFVVIFSTGAPVYPTVAKPGPDGVARMKLKKHRHEDLGHWKYVVVGLTTLGVLKAEDPELIVDG
jgi:hypothetical protein